MTTGTPGGSAARAITVLSASRATSRKVGPLAWVVLEELALRTELEADGFAVETSVRELAGSLAAGKDTIATALARLIDLGLVHSQTRRRAGRYAGCTYVLDPDACRHAGLILTVAVEAPPCAVTPCPVEPDAAEPDPWTPDLAGTAGPTPPARQLDPLARSLFDPPEPPVSPTPVPPSLCLPSPSTPPFLPNPERALSTTPPRALPPSNQPDALAPGVRRGAVNVAGVWADELFRSRC